MIEVYQSYLQKSSLFCYPILGIRKHSRFVPSGTYFALKDYYSVSDCRLICIYNNCDQTGFENFSESVIKSSKLFEKVFRISKSQRVYVFNFSLCKPDWDLILMGKYSRLSNGYKNAILDFHKDFEYDRGVLEKILNPDKYYEEFSEIFNVPARVFEEVKEVMDKPNLEKESFKISVFENSGFVSI